MELGKRGSLGEIFDITENKNMDKTLETIESESNDIEKVVENFEKTHNRIKYQSFGKRTMKFVENSKYKKLEKIHEENNKDSDDQSEVNESKDAQDLIRRQSERIEKEIEDIRKIPSGRNIKVFKLLERMQGPKKAPQEATAIIDEQSKELCVSPEEIMKASLAYCRDVLTKNKVEKEH